MRGAWLASGNVTWRTELPLPKPGPLEALIRPIFAGVCQTDFELVEGYKNFEGIPGHEFVGTVVATGSKVDEKQWIGKRVCGEINCGCLRSEKEAPLLANNSNPALQAKPSVDSITASSVSNAKATPSGSAAPPAASHATPCLLCQLDLPTHCLRRTTLGITNRHGVFADYFTLPVPNLHIVPDSVPSEAAVFAEPLAAAYQVLNQISVTSEHSVTVVGDGRLGLMVAQVLRTTGCQLTVVGKHQQKLDLLRSFSNMKDRSLEAEAIPSEDGFSSLQEKTEAKTQRIQTKATGRASAFQTVVVGSEGHLAGNQRTPIGSQSALPSNQDIVIDCTGRPEGLLTCLQCLRPRGILVLKTTIKKLISIDLAAFVVNELTVVGSRCGSSENWKAALNALGKGEVTVLPLVTRRVLLEELPSVLMKKTNDIKIVVDMQSGEKWDKSLGRNRT